MWMELFICCIAPDNLMLFSFSYENQKRKMKECGMNLLVYLIEGYKKQNELLKAEGMKGKLLIHSIETQVCLHFYAQLAHEKFYRLRDSLLFTPKTMRRQQSIFSA